MNKEHVISEIRRTAKANGGVALGRQRFEKETGIRTSDWYGRFWARWSDAVRDAGLEPNKWRKAYDEEFLIEELIRLTRRLGRVPTRGDLMLASTNDSAFPTKNCFRRLGLRHQIVSRIIAFCEVNPGNDDVANLWKEVAVAEKSEDPEEADSASPEIGYVYLLKHGSRREYKIGRTNNPLRREGEVGIQLPEKLQPVHYIKTDDPPGVESYWHNRFAGKRKEGEWFALTTADIRAFKRWKRIY
jgi:hypothetical protein